MQIRIIHSANKRILMGLHNRTIGLRASFVGYNNYSESDPHWGPNRNSSAIQGKRNIILMRLRCETMEDYLIETFKIINGISN